MACGSGLPPDSASGGPRAGDPRAEPMDNTLWAAGDVVLIDADAGPVGADGEPRGRLWRIPAAALLSATDSAPVHPEKLLEDATWLDPVAAVTLRDGALAVLESRREAEHGGRGGLDRVDPVTGAVRTIWTDARARQPVGIASAPDGSRLWVVDRSADPGGLGRPTGCVFELEPAPAGAWRTRAVVADPAFVTPGAVTITAAGRVLILDADANPHGLLGPGGLPATPGVLFALDGAGLTVLAEPRATISPVGLVARHPDELWLVDANESLDPARLGDGALFRITPVSPPPWHIVKVLDTAQPSVPGRVLVDPAGVDLTPDGRLVLADANADPLNLGADGHGRGVYGTGRGAVLLVDVSVTPPVVRVLAAGPELVTPLGVHVVRPSLRDH